MYIFAIAVSVPRSNSRVFHIHYGSARVSSLHPQKIIIFRAAFTFDMGEK